LVTENQKVDIVHSSFEKIDMTAI